MRNGNDGVEEFRVRRESLGNRRDGNKGGDGMTREKTAWAKAAPSLGSL